MILIYCSEVTQRVSYIFNYIFKDILLSDISFTNTETEFVNFKGPKLVYGTSPIGDNIFFSSVPLLFESNIHPQPIEFCSYKGIRCFFPVKNSALPFDVFAASFYLITRYEEYLPNEKDHHKRFKPEQSIAWKGDFIDKPVINIWATEIKEIILTKFPKHTFFKSQFSFTPTLDIDNAYAFKYKGVLKNILRAFSEFATLHFSRSISRIKVLARLQQDPYDSYEKIQAIHEKYNIKPVFFFLVGKKGKYDRNLSNKNPYFRKLIGNVSSHSAIGLHPSYGSNQDLKTVLEEKNALEDITGSSITRSRQHYIKLNFPETYLNLIKAGITEDYSMGYPSACGFRAGCCTPFLFYNLQKEETTNLKVFPFVFMDTTLKVYLKKRSSEILPFISKYIEEIKKVGGNLIFIFHNESIGTGKMWKNWENMYEDIIKAAIKE